ncbi:MAG: hypothetical protein L3J39_19520 [Verrucomicrobiales bacterium]|nr:hypothetical protein [Verrucomicrobiales bacterium]
MQVPLSFQERPYAREHFLKIAEYARLNNAFYKQWLAGQDQVPILDRKTFLENNDAILNGQSHNGKTSGSTGVPVRYIHSPRRRAMSQADTQAFIKALGGKMRCLRMVYKRTQSDREKADPDLMDVKSPIAQQIEYILQRRREGQITAITTYPSNADMLAQEILERGIDVSFIERFGLFSENVEPFQRERVQQAFPNAKIWTSYSSMEFGMIAAQCQHEPDFHHIMAHRLGVEVLKENEDAPAEDGERGRVVITDYVNRRSPFIRYEIGDYAVKGACPCGKTALPALRSIYGKVRGALVHRDGKRHLFADISYDLRDLPGMRQYQVVQHSVEDFTVRIHAAQPLDEEVKAIFLNHFGYLPEGLKMDYMDEIAKGENGKFYHSICEV